MLWGGFFDVANRLGKIKEDEHLSASSDFWNDPKKAQGIMKQIQYNKQWVDAFNDAKAKVDETDVLYEFYQQGEGDEREVENHYHLALKSLDDLEFKSTFTSPQDSLG